MTNKQPRDSDGQFMSIEEVKSEGEVTFMISEFECRVIGNRFHRLRERYKEILKDSEIESNINQDLEHWGRKFLNKCSTREKHDEEYYENGKKRHTDSNYTVKVVLTGYECWSLGNRLYEIGQWFEDLNHQRVAGETKWLARRFHAERKEQIE